MSNKENQLEQRCHFMTVFIADLIDVGTTGAIQNLE
jgi:hypothetical protein